MEVSPTEPTGFQQVWIQWSAESPKEHVSVFMNNIKALNTLETDITIKINKLKHKIFCQDDGTLSVDKPRKRDQIKGFAGIDNPKTDLKNIEVLLSETKTFAKEVRGAKFEELVSDLNTLSKKISGLEQVYRQDPANEFHAKKAELLHNINEKLGRDLQRIETNRDWIPDHVGEASIEIVRAKWTPAQFIEQFAGREPEVLNAINTLPGGKELIGLLYGDERHPISEWWKSKPPERRNEILPYILYDFASKNVAEDTDFPLSLKNLGAAAEAITRSGTRVEEAGVLVKALLPTYWDEKNRLTMQVALLEGLAGNGMLSTDGTLVVRPEPGGLAVAEKGKERIKKKDVAKKVGIAGGVIGGTMAIAAAAATAPLWAPTVVAGAAVTGLGILATAAAGYAAKKGIEATGVTTKFVRQTLKEKGASKETLKMFDKGVGLAGTGAEKILSSMSGDGSVAAIADTIRLDKKTVKDILSKAQESFKPEEEKPAGSKPEKVLTEKEYKDFMRMMEVYAQQQASSSEETSTEGPMITEVDEEGEPVESSEAIPLPDKSETKKLDELD